MTKLPIVLVAHNVRSLWNIGAFFRSSDAFGVSHVHLTGYTAAPPRTEITKTALGADAWIPWSSSRDVMQVIATRKAEGYEIVALEISQASTPLPDHRATRPICLIVGHEILGVPKEVMDASDRVVHIPMSGQKHSLNVSVAAGIALFHYRCCI